MLFVTLIIINSRLISRLQMSKTGKHFFMKYIVKISWLQKIRTNNYCSYTKRLKPQRRRLNAQDSGKAISMLQTGMSQNAVGRLINRPQSVIDVTVVGKVFGNRISPGKTSK